MLASFRWIVPGKLAGSGQPGLIAPLEADLEFLRENGFRMIVTLTETPLDLGPGGDGLRLAHFPIVDMETPTPRAAEGLCRSVLSIAEREPVLVHCRAGLGRTGTIAACCLVTLGRTAQEAITEARRLHPGYVQNQRQERFVQHYEAHVRTRPPWTSAWPGREGEGGLP